jgi:hypothetical protein
MTQAGCQFGQKFPPHLISLEWNMEQQQGAANELKHNCYAIRHTPSPISASLPLFRLPLLILGDNESWRLLISLVRWCRIKLAGLKQFCGCKNGTQQSF